MHKHEAHESTGKGYEVYKDLKDGRRIFRAKGVIARSRAFDTPAALPAAPEPFSLDQWDVRIGDWARSRTQMHTLEYAKRLEVMLPQQFRVRYPARCGNATDTPPIGLTTGLSYELERK